MNNEKIHLYLRQGEGKDYIHMSADVPKELADRMAELREQDPQKWHNRDLDLLKEAQKELYPSK